MHAAPDLHRVLQAELYSASCRVDSGPPYGLVLGTEIPNEIISESDAFASIFASRICGHLNDCLVQKRRNKLPKNRDFGSILARPKLDEIVEESLVEPNAQPIIRAFKPG